MRTLLVVSMSADGGITAAGGPGYDSLYAFKISESLTSEPIGGELLSFNLISNIIPLTTFVALIALTSFATLRKIKT
jgi:hypothetical protein